MKILTTVTYYYPYWTGLSAFATRVAEGLAARGHEVLVVTSQNRKDLPLEDAHNLVRIIRLSCRSWPLARLPDLRGPNSQLLSPCGEWTAHSNKRRNMTSTVELRSAP